jgi:hypothetical protein
VWIELSGGICPLTPLENDLRRLGGETAYGGDFVAHYLLPVLYPEGLDSGIQAALAAAVLALNDPPLAERLDAWRAAHSESVAERPADADRPA